MFPEEFVQTYLLAFSHPDDCILDPFCGRGTTILESLLNRRMAIGTDINPVAACISGAKANTPDIDSIIQRLNALENLYDGSTQKTPPSEFFQWCFSIKTFRQIQYLRANLKWKNDPHDRFIAAVMLGVLHGESHRTELCLSNRMPRTISTKPAYSVRWWKRHDSRPPERDVFKVLRKAIEFRLAQGTPGRWGRVELSDARRAAQALSEHKGRVKLLITSPPYLDTTDYAEDQWLRLWLLGGAEQPVLRLHSDDRHRDWRQYWRFLTECWAGCEELLGEQVKVVVRIGGNDISKDDLLCGLQGSLREGLRSRTVHLLYAGVTTVIKRPQTNAFHPRVSSQKFEHDFVFCI
jgi:hypothetical protein